MSNEWLIYALLTVIFWGVYGVLLHEGQSRMADANAEIARYKSFLWVGVAYFLVAIIGPIVLLKAKAATWAMSFQGVSFSLIAGVAGAIGAFGVLLALSAKGGAPPNVMSVVFAGAPIVNAVVALWWHPPAGGWKAVNNWFWLGIVLAIIGGVLVTKNKPAPPKPQKTSAVAPGYIDVTTRTYYVS
jgi:drug/metabolite transporter (DMT)-like permease